MTWSMMCAGLDGRLCRSSLRSALFCSFPSCLPSPGDPHFADFGGPAFGGRAFVVHALVPPHPAAMLAVKIFHADVGRTILYGLLVGIPRA